MAWQKNWLKMQNINHAFSLLTDRCPVPESLTFWCNSRIVNDDMFWAELGL
jgi:hypothetical protein